MKSLNVQLIIYIRFLKYLFKRYKYFTIIFLIGKQWHHKAMLAIKLLSIKDIECHHTTQQKYVCYTRSNSKVSGLYKKKNKKLVFCKHFIAGLRNSPLRTEYNDLHDHEDYRMNLLGHPSVWR